jgi:hypothetical protein
MLAKAKNQFPVSCRLTFESQRSQCAQSSIRASTAHEVSFAFSIVLNFRTMLMPVAQSGGQALEAYEQFEHLTAFQHHEV